jgi:hypothetical protein
MPSTLDTVSSVAAPMASAIAALLEAYLAAGVLFAGAFLLSGIVHVDRTVATSSRWLRLLLAPGTVALWPVLAWKWAGGAVPRERTAHRVSAAEAGRRAEAFGRGVMR